ncbi:hypothetical protein E4U42_000253 [Claviceps africana]|uniref:RRM domain-containing protein n=1 Tax=Claviceps africana TaxID=83212 RepID=A0A8K0JAU3_9HYPO|nr:hypothetical protein E4U42_000253 [Claviceps africana]
MAYQPPPGTSSLPPRPPVSGNNGRPGFKPAFPSTSNPPGQAYASAAPPYSTGAPGYASGTSTALGAAQYGPSAYSSYPGVPGAGMSSSGRGGAAGRGGVGGYGYHQTTSHHSYGAPGYNSQASTSYSSAPQIRNPFPAPAPAAPAHTNNNGGGGISVSSSSDYDPDMAAQIAHWQSAYSREPADAAAAVAAAAPALDSYGRPITTVETPRQDFQPQTGAPTKPEKKKTVVRQGGGKKWTDDTLLQWDPAHLRLFVGNLAGETTDDSLLKAFTPWKSVQRAKVVRDKRTNKSKGYGFVSFSDADDFFNAAKTMNGQYIQSHPVIIKKANTEIKAVTAKEKKGGKNNRRGQHHRGSDPAKQHQTASGHGAAPQTTYEASLGPAHAGVTKPGQKTKNGLRLLG